MLFNIQFSCMKVWRPTGAKTIAFASFAQTWTWSAWKLQLLELRCLWVCASPFLAACAGVGRAAFGYCALRINWINLILEAGIQLGAISFASFGEMRIFTFIILISHPAMTLKCPEVQTEWGRCNKQTVIVIIIWVFEASSDSQTLLTKGLLEFDSATSYLLKHLQHWCWF